MVVAHPRFGQRLDNYFQEQAESDSIFWDFVTIA
jgi:hypothetical protein